MNNKQTKTLFISQLRQGILPSPKTPAEYAVYKKLKFGKQYGELFTKTEGSAA